MQTTNVEVVELVTIAEATAIVGISRKAIYDRIAAGDMPRPLKVGRRRLFARRTLQDYLSRRQAERAAELSVAELAAMLRIGRRTLERLVRSDIAFPAPRRRLCACRHRGLSGSRG